MSGLLNNNALSLEIFMSLFINSGFLWFDILVLIP